MSYSYLTSIFQLLAVVFELIASVVSICRLQPFAELTIVPFFINDPNGFVGFCGAVGDEGLVVPGSPGAKPVLAFLQEKSKRLVKHITNVNLQSLFNLII